MNPELERNIWLDLSLQRLLLTPAVLMLVYFVATAAPGNDAAALTKTFGVVLIIGTLWGALRAYRCVLDEVRERTWDFQRMSSLGAWTMTWGKILGSTIFQWYLIALALLVFVSASLQTSSFDVVLRLVYAYVAGTLLIYSTAFLGSLDDIAAKEGSNSAGRGGFGFLIPLLFVFPLTGFFFSLAKSLEAGRSTAIGWYGIGFNFSNFFLVSLTIFLFWAVFGAYRMIRAELQYVSAPWAWLAFLVFVMFYGSGFIQDPTDSPTTTLSLRLLYAFMVAVAGAYLMIWREPKNPVVLRKCLGLLRSKLYYQAFATLPRWMVCILVAFPLALVQPIVRTGDSEALKVLGIYNVPLIIFLMCIRDILLFLYVHLGKGTVGRKDLAALFYLGLLYGLIPMLAFAIHLNGLARFFYPWLPGREAVGIVYGIIWIGGFLVLLRKRWQASAAV